MARRVFLFDQRRCFGCHGCTAACSNANETSAELLWRNVYKLPPTDGSSETVWLSLACNHCAEPSCMKACPSGAIEKRGGDGVVLLREERCIGCRYCQMACPYGAIRWDARRGVVGKCHFCLERLEQGREPACVETCFAGALTQRVVGDDAELEGYALEVPGFTYRPRLAPSIRFMSTVGKKGLKER